MRATSSRDMDEKSSKNSLGNSLSSKDSLTIGGNTSKLTINNAMTSE